MANTRYSKLQPIRGRGTNTVSLMSWAYVQRALDASNRVEYEGKNTDPNASDQDPSWVITKFITFASNGVVTKEKTLIGKWSLRTSLSW